MSNLLMRTSGREALRPSYLVPGNNGLKGEVEKLRRDVTQVLSAMAPIHRYELTVGAAAPDADAIKTSVASTTSATDYSGTALNGVVGAGEMRPPRNITATTAGVTPAHVPATATVYGFDIWGKPISETITLAQTATIATGTKCFRNVTRITMPAGQGTAGTLTFGFGETLGFSVPPKDYDGAVRTLSEFVDGEEPLTPGVLFNADDRAPYGGYEPDTAANGAVLYSLLYEFDPGLVPTGTLPSLE